ncbi:hypothetical protein XENOCAPTIV_002517 [Xenoophorus captivus]|uniref:Uncharacterized protein n=1 Tax=Xenoophorus captivus TaxID=1517983 RepID=A0ABV0RQ08_9TELE
MNYATYNRTDSRHSRDAYGGFLHTHQITSITHRKEMDLMCKVTAGPQRKTYTDPIEGHHSLQLPQDLLVAKVLADVKGGCTPVRVMNLSQHPVTIKPHTHLANVFLVDGVLDLSGKKQGKSHGSRSKETCLSLTQVISSSGVDLSEAAVEDEHQRCVLKELVDKNVDVFSRHPLD